MMDFEFVESTGTLCCRFYDRMDSVRTMEADSIFHDRLAGMAQSTATADSPAHAAAPLSPVNRIVFDLAQVDYVSSAFMKLCLQVCRQIGKGNFSVVNTSPQIMKVFKVACLDESLEVS